MYEFMVLGQLSRQPMHGYKIAKILGHIIGPFRHMQWGTLYPVLKRLEVDGLIRAEGGEEDSPSARSRKVYAITDAGLQRLHQHLLDTDSHLGEYETVFTHKLAFFHRLTPEERIRLSRHYAVYAQQQLDHHERKRRELETVPHPHLTVEAREDLYAVMDHAIDHWAQERAWAEGLIAKFALQEAM